MEIPYPQESLQDVASTSGNQQYFDRKVGKYRCFNVSAWCMLTLCKS